MFESVNLFIFSVFSFVVTGGSWMWNLVAPRVLPNVHETCFKMVRAQDDLSFEGMMCYELCYDVFVVCVMCCLCTWEFLVYICVLLQCFGRRRLLPKGNWLESLS